jgi:DNA-binding transcriptional ArsR family regulator
MYRCCYIRVVDSVIQAIADPSRRQLMALLSSGSATAGELADQLPIARPGVSRHLRVLREAGLVEVHTQAQWRVYSLRPEGLAELDDWLSGYRAVWQARMGALHAEVERGKRE